ncbi:GntR family transcriptional regulator [Bradyrhizobium sacchari]|uniref:GntR family transcriptional regulator n=1 Tax=Bradyrhizobium sacchari TaxID=1399419 RepID=A0A560JAJ4_9BRAD|nr:FCD domain-containing protein [Bradyrhizobium sacchari]OPY94100.1 GntR family transcriptional regulator [Bradyrhizobium sacchari]TWB49368.1 GntR family transcriptional regulator [Bradyrhizobium sacchari]TWB68198.1 GntR family transcriptional regulator [Bradyrhizobium sacchari]
MSLIDKEESAIGEDGYRRIRTDIIFGRLAPGHKLRLEALRETYGVSVSTLREILNRLAAEGFVAAEGKRGFEVAAVSADNLRELAGLRLLLESHAMAISFANADVEWEGRIVSAHHKLASTERLMDTGIGEPEQWKRYDGEFHQALISNCGSRLLMETHSLVFDRYFRYQMVAFHYRGAEPAAQHKALLECALKRDADTATLVLSAHVNNCVAHALANSALR